VVVCMSAPATSSAHNQQGLVPPCPPLLILLEACGEAAGTGVHTHLSQCVRHAAEGPLRACHCRGRAAGPRAHAVAARQEAHAAARLNALARVGLEAPVVAGLVPEHTQPAAQFLRGEAFGAAHVHAGPHARPVGGAH